MRGTQDDENDHLSNTPQADLAGPGNTELIHDRQLGLSRCNWKGLDHFKAYIRSAVFTHNLVVLTQRLAASG